MKPSDKEIDDAIAEEAAAMKEFTEASGVKVEASLAVEAARGRLMRARAAKSALVHDMMTYGA